MDSELRQYLHSMESRLGDRIGSTETFLIGRIEAAKTEVIEHMTGKMLDNKTELLKGFAAYSGPTTIRLRKIEADQSNLDAVISVRFHGATSGANRAAAGVDPSLTVQ